MIECSFVLVNMTLLFSLQSHWVGSESVGCDCEARGRNSKMNQRTLASTDVGSGQRGSEMERGNPVKPGRKKGRAPQKERKGGESMRINRAAAQPVPARAFGAINLIVIMYTESKIKTPALCIQYQNCQNISTYCVRYFMCI